MYLSATLEVESTDEFGARWDALSHQGLTDG
jgi:hypothetical protein